MKGEEANMTLKCFFFLNQSGEVEDTFNNDLLRDAVTASDVSLHIICVVKHCAHWLGSKQ